MHFISEQENSMWEAALKKDSGAFAGLVSADAVMVCGGCRMTGEQYAELVADFGISGYDITNFEVVMERDDTVQVHYVIRTAADCPENADLAGVFHVTSTWQKQDGIWKLIFNMDQRVVL